MSEDGHTCFGCQKTIADHEPHIHLTMDEWSERQGLGSLGVGDLLRFAICEPCTQRTDDGWQLEAHEIPREAPHA